MDLPGVAREPRLRAALTPTPVVFLRSAETQDEVAVESAIDQLGQASRLLGRRLDPGRWRDSIASGFPVSSKQGPYVVALLGLGVPILGPLRGPAEAELQSVLLYPPSEQVGSFVAASLPWRINHLSPSANFRFAYDSEAAAGQRHAGLSDDGLAVWLNLGDRVVRFDYGSAVFAFGTDVISPPLSDGAFYDHRRELLLQQKALRYESIHSRDVELATGAAFLDAIGRVAPVLLRRGEDPLPSIRLATKLRRYLETPLAT